MMRIKSISQKPDRAGKFSVLFDCGEKIGLYRQTIEDFGLFPGLELSDEQMEKLYMQAGSMSAKMRAVRIVSASSVSRRDLEQRLIRKGENPVQAKEAVEWMEKFNLIDDRETARQIVSRAISRGYGPARARQMLYEKQIPKEFWEGALENYPDQSEKIMDYLQVRLGEDPDQRDIKRASDALIRRGYSWNDVRKALSQILENQSFREEL